MSCVLDLIRVPQSRRPQGGRVLDRRHGHVEDSESMAPSLARDRFPTHLHARSFPRNLMSPPEFCVETTVPSSFIYVCRHSSSAHILMVGRCVSRNSDYPLARQGTRRESLVSGIAVTLVATGTTPRQRFTADRFVPIRGCVPKCARSKNKDRE